MLEGDQRWLGRGITANGQRLGWSFVQGDQEPLPAIVLQKNQHPPVAAIHHLVNRPFRFHANFAGHA